MSIEKQLQKPMLCPKCGTAMEWRAALHAYRCTKANCGTIVASPLPTTLHGVMTTPLEGKGVPDDRSLAFG